ncbi:MAG: hypothetical protein JNM62_15835 [Flavobacteriales bacterium]|nr:hypothetical protein [Flavobacteriales bacterium]
MRLFAYLLILLCPVFATAQDRPIQRSENGWYLSPQGTIRILLLFVEVEFDVKPEKDPQPGGADHWPKGQLPKWKDRVFDPFPLPQQQADVSRYFQDISLGRYIVLGDYVDEIITLKESKYPGVHQGHTIGTLAVKELNERDSLRTHHRFSVADFDMWKDARKAGLPKEPGPDTPHGFDHVMVIVRNSQLKHGTGSTDGGSPGPLFGYQSDTQSRFGGMNDLPFEILKHEYNHLLIGGNNFHSGGGNASQFESTFINLQGGWSMMGASSSSLLTCTGWDRLRMGWEPDGAAHRIRARDLRGNEVDTDLDPTAGDTGLFVLRDFVTTGDALRIRMPYIPADQLQQWIWVENHLGMHRNGSPTDRFHWESPGGTCITPIQPGLFMQMQVGRELREGADIYSGAADYLRPILANGNYDLRLRGDTLRNMCPFGGSSRPFIHEAAAANPLTGNHEQELPVFDQYRDGLLFRGEHWVPGVRIQQGKPDAEVVFSGRPEHAFRMNGARVLGMGTNPSSANMLTLISTGNRDVHKRKGPNVRTVYLNGVRLELMDQWANGDALVRVTINDTRIEEDQRWCADSIVLPPLRGGDGHSLSVADGRTLLLDRSRTPTRVNEPDSIAPGGPWFSEPTRFTLSEGASMFIGPKARLELKAGSVMHLMTGSRLELGPKAQLTVGSDCAIIMHGDVLLLGKQKVFRKLRKKGRLREAQ